MSCAPRSMAWPRCRTWARTWSVEAWGPQWEEPALRAANRLNESEWGRPPLTQEQWMQGRTAFAPEWSFLAVDRTGDRPRVAGFLLASRYEQDWAALGWREATSISWACCRRGVRPVWPTR